jgi:hypothetical protein
MRKETLHVGTWDEIQERYKNKKCPGKHTIQDQLAQYSPDYPKNFGCLLFYGLDKGKVNICKEFFFVVDPSPFDGVIFPTIK